MEPTWGLLAWQGLAALITLAVLSFLIGDNPIYKLVERFWVGITTGYWTMLLYHTSFHDKVLVPIFQHGQWYYLIPTMLGILMWFRLSPRRGWLSRFALAFYIGIAMGVFIPLAFKAGVFLQVEGTIRPVTADAAGVNFILALIGLVCSLSYFFFSRHHTGTFGVISKVGIYTLMIGFGAGFGLTVMGRVALLVQRVIFLRDYFISLWDKIL
jgi:hypothetical protein